MKPLPCRQEPPRPWARVDATRVSGCIKFLRRLEHVINNNKTSAAILSFGGGRLNRHLVEILILSAACVAVFAQLLVRGTQFTWLINKSVSIDSTAWKAEELTS